MSIRKFHCLALAAALTIVPVLAEAQSIVLSAVRVDADHQLLGDAMNGVALAMRTPDRSTPFSFQFEIAHVRGSSDRVGSTCTGLIPPGTDCTPQPLRDDARLTTVSGGGAFRILRARRISVALTADLSIADVSAETRGLGLSTLQLLTASKRLWGGTVGARAAWAPTERWPLALEFGAGVGALKPVSEEGVVDGYTPFERKFDVSKFSVGVTWSSRGPAR